MFWVIHTSILRFLGSDTLIELLVFSTVQIILHSLINLNLYPVVLIVLSLHVTKIV